MKEEINQNPEIQAFQLSPSHNFPNNHIPALLYKAVIQADEEHTAALFEEQFRKNNWGNGWRNGIFSYHHYHSNTHEVLGIYAGEAKVQLGGPEGEKFAVTKGDMIIIPAGVAHKNLGSSAGFGCVGAYPNGRDYDLNEGSGNLEENKENIKNTPFPEKDPLYGVDGPLQNTWR